FTARRARGPREPPQTLHGHGGLDRRGEALHRPEYGSMKTTAASPMLSLDEALQRLRDGTRAIAETEQVATVDALGRVLAADVRPTLDVPAHDNSAMDGYALRVADVPVAGTVLPVSQRIAAGQVGAMLEPGTAARIFTGAPVPQGADAVVMQEQCEA